MPLKDALGSTAGLPPGTRIGDGVMVVTGAPVGASIGQGAEQFHTTIDAPGVDPGCKFFLGKIDTLDPIEINLEGSGGALTSEHALIVTVHGTLLTDTITVGTSVGAGPIQLTPESDLKSAVVLATFWSGVGGPNWIDPTGGGAEWNSAGAVSVYHGVGAAWTPGPVSGTVETSVQGDWISALLIGVRTSTMAPPCRLYPGGIQGTVGGAVRQYPPQKYRQASSRGVGCY